MSASDEFRKQLKAGKIVEALTLALGEAIELEITTWVADDDKPTQGSTQSKQGNAGNRMRTRINLVDGDIENEIGSNFIGESPYAELRDFHLEQVKEGRHIIQQNLESLQQMFVIFAGTMSRLSKNSGNSPRLSPSDREN
ncbi:hypothetical protein PN462_08135 [Spirulina sp. CS-785/01]|uniref:hypothetical protein n=1 Tax=Spirulina sp. CS-785/01 TaxID=3021716 RepID=UPI00232E0739|nr:hypothetical protein [Spirulina sp. CS-785/01]MDB9313067.1 hypothetical protein [Spirulina sp. CS-785/01]